MAVGYYKFKRKAYEVAKGIYTRLRKSSLFKDSFWAFGGNACWHGLSLLSAIFVARFLGKYEYGEFSMIKTTLYQITYLSTFGFGYTITRFVSKYISEQNLDRLRPACNIATNITMFTSGFFAFLVFLFADDLSLFLNAPGTSSSFRLSAVVIFLNSVTTTQAGILSGFKDFKVLARNNSINGVLLCILSIVLTWQFGLNGALMALALSFLFLCSINYASTLKHRRKLPKTSVTKPLVKSLVTFTFPVALQELSYSVLHWLTMLLLIKKADYGQLGLYNIAAQWVAIVIFIPGTLKNVILSYLSGENRNRHQTVNLLLKINFLTTLVPLVLILSCSGLITTMYGPNFSGLRLILSVYLLSTVFTAMADVYNFDYISAGKVWRIFCYRFIRDLSILLIAYGLINYYKENQVLILVGIADIVAIVYFLLLHCRAKIKLQDHAGNFK